MQRDFRDASIGPNRKDDIDIPNILGGDLGGEGGMRSEMANIRGNGHIREDENASGGNADIRKPYAKDKDEEEGEKEENDNEERREREAMHVVDRLDMEVWYEVLEEFTFESRIVDVRLAEARACLEFYEDEKFGSPGARPTIARIAEMKANIEKAMLAIGGKAFFIRLSTRRTKTRQLVKQELSSLKQRDETTEILALTRAVHKSTCVGTAEEALDYLLHSTQVYEDLFARLLLSEENFAMRIAVRRWYDIRPEWEFRGFVHDHKLTSATQLHRVFVPEMAAQKKSLERRLIAFYGSIRRLVKEESYNFDVAVLPDRIYLVDLNHLESTSRGGMAGGKAGARGSGGLRNGSLGSSVGGGGGGGDGADNEEMSGLFDWANEADAHRLRNGPFELRMLEQKPRFGKMLLAARERNLMVAAGVWDAAQLEEESRRFAAEGGGLAAALGVNSGMIAAGTCVLS